MLAWSWTHAWGPIGMQSGLFQLLFEAIVLGGLGFFNLGTAFFVFKYFLWRGFNIGLERNKRVVFILSLHQD